MASTSRLDHHVPVTRSDSFGDHLWMANLSVEEPDALMCARPGLWEPWWVTARATQPDARKSILPGTAVCGTDHWGFFSSVLVDVSRSLL